MRLQGAECADGSAKRVVLIGEIVMGVRVFG